jgi:talin
MIDVNRQNVTSHLSAMNAATAQVVTLTSNGPNGTDYNAVGAAVLSISTNLGDFSKDIVMIAALQDDQQGECDRLLDAAKRLCTAFNDFLKYVEPECTEPRQNLFSAVGKIGEAGNEIMRNLNKNELMYTDSSSTSSSSTTTNHELPRLQETFISLAKTVASSTAGLVIASKNVANHCEHQQGVNEVISLVTQCALSTSQLVSCTKVCASTISSRECQEQIIEAARQVSRQVDAVIDCASLHCKNEKPLNDLKQCARNVTESVMSLLENVKGSNEQMVTYSMSNNNNNNNNNSNNNKVANAQHQHRQEESIDKIFNATDNLFNSMGDAAEMIRQAKFLAQATTELVNSLKQEAHNQQTNDQQRKLLLAAKLLAEATSKMVEAAKGCATNPQDSQLQINLKKAAEELKNATTIAAGDNIQMKLIKRLELCAKQAASCATQSIAAIQVCTLHAITNNTNNENEEEIMNNNNANNNNNNQTHTYLIQQCKQVADNVPKIVQGIRGCMVSPNSKSAHIGLINSCENFLSPAQKMIALTKAVLPTIVDEIKAIQLRNCTNQLANSISELKMCLSQVNI